MYYENKLTRLVEVTKELQEKQSEAEKKAQEASEQDRSINTEERG